MWKLAHSFLRRIFLGRGNDQCKSPEVKMFLLYGNSEEAGVTMAAAP